MTFLPHFLSSNSELLQEFILYISFKTKINSSLFLVFTTFKGGKKVKRSKGRERLMESHFIDKNIDLATVGRWIENFFEKKGFKPIKEVIPDGYKIISRPHPSYEIIGLINVLVTGDSNDFYIKFFSGSRSEAYVKFGQLTSLFGGGVLFLRGLKSQENEKKLEKSFWLYIEERMNTFMG